MIYKLATALSLSGVALAQQKGTVTPEVHPSLSIYNCNATGGCNREDVGVVLDANWRWLHNVDGYTNCYDGTTWNSEYCPDGASCAANCALDGADYSSTYGVTTSGSQVNVGYVTGGNVGSRLYVSEGEQYRMFKMKNQEISFDVDVSELPCGLNGAVYFVEMDATGNKGSGSNAAGAEYGTGYCDAQCPHDIKFIYGEANLPSSGTDFSSGGAYGTCCHEFDLWEANSMAEAYTGHTCNTGGLTKCDADCNDICDQPGCDNNPWRTGSHSFFGPGMTVDTTQPFSVVTQFITEKGDDFSDLTEVKRFFVQNGNKIENPAWGFEGEALNSLSDAYCDQQFDYFGETNVFGSKGGMRAMGESLDRGVVLVISLWDDAAANMLWLDSDYPLDADNTQPGVNRGPCARDSGVPEEERAKYPDSSYYVKNIKTGPIGSTTA